MRPPSPQPGDCRDQYAVDRPVLQRGTGVEPGPHPSSPPGPATGPPRRVPGRCACPERADMSVPASRGVGSAYRRPRRVVARGGAFDPLEPTDAYVAEPE